MSLALTNYNAMDNVYYKTLIFPFNTLDVNAPGPTHCQKNCWYSMKITQKIHHSQAMAYKTSEISNVQNSVFNKPAVSLSLDPKFLNFPKKLGRLPSYIHIK